MSSTQLEEKVTIITKQNVAGNPEMGFKKITWYDFLFDAGLETQEEIEKCAYALLRGEWLFYNNSSYFILENWQFPYLKSEHEKQLERMKVLGINTDTMTFEQCVNTILQIAELKQSIKL